ncbi:MAG: inner membrane-spanning protein YciB [Parvularculaceae bacterium]
MSSSKVPGEKLKGGAKFAVDMGPLLVFMIAYFFGRRLAGFAGTLAGRDWSVAPGEEMYLAIGLFMPAFAIAFAYSVWKERRVAPMLLVSGVVVGVFGSLTLILHNKTFFFMKPTVIYALFALLLASGLATGRNFLKTAFDGALHLEDGAWRTLTKRYVYFFAALGLANEIAWRWLTRDCDLAAAVDCAGEPTWVNLKVFGFTGASLIFTALQTPFIATHMKDAPGGAG